jgi:hypothetical protein
MRFSRRFAAERTLVLFAALLLCHSACAAGSDASRSSSLPASVATRAARPVIVVHAWKDFLTYWNGLSASQKSASPRSVRDAQKIYLDGDDGTVHRYFSTRGGGQELIALGDWLALPASAFDAVAAALSDPARQAKLEKDAQDLAARVGRVGAPTDTLEFVFLVGDFSNYTTSWVEGGKQMVAVQLESFVPLGRLRAADATAIQVAQVWRPDSLAGLDNVMPWAAYASARQFMPELRERITAESENFAEHVLFHGWSSCFAGSLYPESVFGRGLGPVRAEPGGLLDHAWQDIGPTWTGVGTKPYLSARYEDQLTSKLPAGTNLDQAIAVIGARAADQWLNATRIRRDKDEAAEVSRLGRVPTLSAWQLLAQQ